MLLRDMATLHPILLFPLFALAFFPFVSAVCSRICGGAEDVVPYPFGFSAECPIRLNCSGGDDPKVRLGPFHVRNVTPDRLLIDVPAVCNRSIGAAYAFFGENYAMAANNTLLLQNCISNASGCIISASMLSLDPGSGCTAQSGNISCFSANTTVNGGEPLLSLEYVNRIGCGHLFTSVAYGADKLGFRSVQFGAVELGWWLDGNCSLCSADASCTTISRPVTGGEGVTCRCGEGLIGDGFAAGSGCRRELPPRCNPPKNLSGGCGGTTRVGLLIGGIAAGATLMFSLGLLCYFIRRRRSSFSRIRKSTKLLLSEASCNVPFYPFKEIERATDGFSDENRLGTGAYGTVYVGKLHNNGLVAVKKIKHHDTDDGIEQVMNEIKLLSSVSHPNLVQLLGCCIDRGEQILVYDYMPNGTLSQHLQRENSRPGLPWSVRLTIASETAKAIAHLHSAINPPIYHRDIKSTNILLDYNFSSKVADFGLSRMIATESSHISTAPQGTPGYLDPQYHQNFHLSDKSDVYSFGVVLVEIITGLKVVDFSRPQNEVNLAALAVDKIGKGCVEEIIDSFLDQHRDAWTLSSIHKVAELAFRCLAFHRDMRPSMVEVADELEQISLGGLALTDENNFMSSASSLCSSSPSNSTDRLRVTSESRRLVSVKAIMEEMKVDSPVSVQDPCFSDQSSPSTNSLLGNVIL